MFSALISKVLSNFSLALTRAKVSVNKIRLYNTFILSLGVFTVSENYNASEIEVLTGLDPVRKRPGMYTDTTRPNHLAQEVIDNSVDEALLGLPTILP